MPANFRLSSLAVPALAIAVAVAGGHAAAISSGGDSKAAGALIPKVKPATPNDLDFRPGVLRLVTDTDSGARFWVFTYAVANKTGKTQRFSPRFELLMGDGTILEAGRDVSVEAGRRVLRSVGSDQALDQFQIMGEILDGEANAREGVVVWPAKGDSKEITLFVAGMSSAFDRVKDPATGKDVTIRRSWSRQYAVPGVTDPRVASEASFDPIKDAWLMR
jgi:hypothetical protein